MVRRATGLRPPQDTVICFLLGLLIGVVVMAALCAGGGSDHH